MADDLFQSEPSITSPAEKKILADVMRQFNISQQIAERTKDRYSPANFTDSADTYAIERARQLTDLLNRSQMHQSELDAAAANEAARNAAIAASRSNMGGGGGGGISQADLQRYMDALQRQNPGMSKTDAFMKALGLAGQLSPYLFGKNNVSNFLTEGVVPWGVRQAKNIFGGSNTLGSDFTTDMFGRQTALDQGPMSAEQFFRSTSLPTDLLPSSLGYGNPSDMNNTGYNPSLIPQDNAPSNIFNIPQYNFGQPAYPPPDNIDYGFGNNGE